MNNTKVNEVQNKIIQNRYNVGRGGIKHWFEKVSLLWIVEFKKLFKTPMIWFGVVGIPIILLFGVGALVQDGAMFTPCFGSIPIIVSGVVFGDLYYSIEESTMKQSTETTNYGHKTKLFTIATVTFFVTILSVFFELGIFIICEMADFFFMPGFVFFDDYHYQSLTIEWLTMQWGNLIYYIVVNTILTIAMFIFMKNFFSSNKTFTMFVLVYFLLDLMFGGILVMNYNQAEVVYENGQLVATGYIANDEVLSGTLKSAWSFDSWYSYTKFLVPHYFINQQFSTMLKVGSVQQSNAFWFDAQGVYHIRWDLGVANPDGFDWMLDAQKIALNDQDLPGILSEDKFAVALTTGLENGTTNLTNVYNAFYKYNRALPQDTYFWKAYNGDYTFILSEVLPWVYIVVLTWVGFVLSRV